METKELGGWGGGCSRLGVIASAVVLPGCCSCIVKQNRWRRTEGTGVGAIVINSADVTSCTVSGKRSNFQKSSLNSW